jgi:hypothetical protein
MRVINFGHVDKRDLVRIYIFSELGPVRPIFHALYQTLSAQIEDAATCTVILLRNKENHSHTIRKFSDRSFWQVLKQTQNDQSLLAWSKIQLEDDLAANRLAQNIVVATEEEFANLLTITATGVTVVTFAHKPQRALAFESSNN